MHYVLMKERDVKRVCVWAVGGWKSPPWPEAPGHWFTFWARLKIKAPLLSQLSNGAQANYTSADLTAIQGGRKTEAEKGKRGETDKEEWRRRRLRGGRTRLQKKLRQLWSGRRRWRTPLLEDWWEWEQGWSALQNKMSYIRYWVKRRDSKWQIQTVWSSGNLSHAD